MLSYIRAASLIAQRKFYALHQGFGVFGSGAGLPHRAPETIVWFVHAGEAFPGPLPTPKSARQTLGVGIPGEGEMAAVAATWFITLPVFLLTPWRPRWRGILLRG